MGMCEPALEMLAEALDDGDRARCSGQGLDERELSPCEDIDHRLMKEFRDLDRAVNGLGFGSCPCCCPCPTGSSPDVLLLS